MSNFKIMGLRVAIQVCINTHFFRIDIEFFLKIKLKLHKLISLKCHNLNNTFVNLKRKESVNTVRLAHKYKYYVSKYVSKSYNSSIYSFYLILRRYQI